MRVAFLTADFAKDPVTGRDIPNGSAFYRAYMPMHAINPIKAYMGLPAWMPNKGFGVIKGKNRAEFGFNIVMLKLLMESHIPHQMRVAQKLGQKIIVDVDDLYDDLSPDNMAYEQTDPDKHKTRNRKFYLESIMQADVVTVSTPYLLEHYSKMRDSVHLVRNAAAPSMFQPYPVRNRKPTIGWVGGVPWRSGDIETLRDWLPDFLLSKNLKFHHGGHVPIKASFADKAGIPQDRFTWDEMVPFNRYPSLFENIGIGIVPLNPVPFNLAKSTAKGFEYACAGVPFVAQALPEYQRLADMGVGRVANTSEEWVQHLTELLDYRTRKREAERNLKLVTEEHSLLSTQLDWFNIFKELM